MSYESEERYWTDYLRVALPVIGLLLMLALFWWWAQQFIGDDGNNADVARATASAIATVPPPTATATQEIAIAPTEITESATEAPSGNNGSNADGTPAADNPGGQDCDFARGDTVLVTEDDVNLREDPDGSAANVIDTLAAGTLLSIVGDCYEEDATGIRYWRVRNSETAMTGYVAADYIQAE